MLCLNKEFCNFEFMIQQYTITLPAFPRGMHLITSEVIQAIPALPETGILHIFIQHTPAALTINENADADVRTDFVNWLNRTVRENESYYVHRLEGSDDMPAHIKSSLMGSSVSVPITSHQLNLGTWQGIYLCEFRNNGGRRKLVLTVTGA
jgi:secondary thiamine-phosphate synthase enzyme